TAAWCRAAWAIRIRWRRRASSGPGYRNSTASRWIGATGRVSGDGSCRSCSGCAIGWIGRRWGRWRQCFKKSDWPHDGNAAQGEITFRDLEGGVYGWMDLDRWWKIGRASCRERVEDWEVAVSVYTDER